MANGKESKRDRRLFGIGLERRTDVFWFDHKSCASDKKKGMALAEITKAQ
jgi:hypothetical protein